MSRQHQRTGDGGRDGGVSIGGSGRPGRTSSELTWWQKRRWLSRRGETRAQRNGTPKRVGRISICFCTDTRPAVLIVGGGVCLSESLVLRLCLCTTSASLPARRDIAYCMSAQCVPMRQACLVEHETRRQGGKKEDPGQGGREPPDASRFAFSPIWAHLGPFFAKIGPIGGNMKQGASCDRKGVVGYDREDGTEDGRKKRGGDRAAKEIAESRETWQSFE